MHTCPHCGGPGITTARKLILGPATRATCRACGRRVGVPGYAMLAVLPFLAGIVLFGVFESLPARVLALGAGAMATFYIHATRVPLVRR